MAQCTPTMKPTLLQGAPVTGVVTPTKVKENGFTSTGAQEAATKETKNSVAWLRRRNKEHVEEKRKLRDERDIARKERDEQMLTVNRQSELFEVQEEQRAKSEAKLRAQRDEAQAKVDSLRTLFVKALAIIDGDASSDAKVDALGSMFAAPDDIQHSGKQHTAMKKEQRR